MFQCGDYVVYGIHGVCQIIAVEDRKIDRKIIEYFVLAPVEQPNARFYIPTKNEAALSKLRPMLTADELQSLLSRNKDKCADWIADENQRKNRYKELITSGDRDALLSMVIALYKHRELQESSGKKFHLCDENFLRDARKLLSTEFSIVLNIAPDEIDSYISGILLGN